MAAKMYGDGSIISAVCHGGALLPGVMSPLTDRSIIAGRKVTGFTTQGEEEEGVLDTIKSWNRPTIEKSAADAGATYIAPPGYASRSNSHVFQSLTFVDLGTRLHRQTTELSLEQIRRVLMQPLKLL